MQVPITEAEILALGVIDPEFEQLVKDLPPDPDLTQIPIQDLRDASHFAMMQARKAQGLVDPPEGVTEENTTVPNRDGYAVPVRIHRPTNKTGGPLFIMFHGGGFIFGTVDSEAITCRNIVLAFDAVCVNVDYRLAPEHPFPAAPNDCWDVTKWAAANAAKLGADPSKGFIVGGTSAGGNLTDVVGHLARDEKLSPPLTGLLELIPAVLSETKVPEQYKTRYLAYDQTQEARGLNRKMIEYMYSLYKPDFDSVLLNTFNHPNGHAELPPVVFQICGMDPLRDDALIYCSVLQEAGVKTNLMIYPGLPHAFWAYYPTHSKSASFRKDTVAGFKWLLEQQVGK